ncbi:hypothetical protein SMSP2_01051 [Limihaloglobus sulfuriphilus]|uniref:Uncharacterized protein n=1 Tax=Limihaloglobus sulfuriphilus TaxID=1851148 RepID=A0A1Q2MDB8_9BACT|nr:hypothetical protein [Limihaloglobus sulfuriphilus]AQQ70693.1 hypothetical protein SMSP2_01051 [Limihaloglobus sulfuriphilus]
MNLFKTLRKHQKWIIISVFIVVMITFIGGQALQALLTSRGPSNRVMATFGDGQKLRQIDIRSAYQQLEVLRQIGAERYLMSNDPIALLVGHILFENDRGFFLDAQFKRMIQQGQLMIKQEDLDKFFNRSNQEGPLYWILLLHEADKAGIAASRQDAIDVLRSNPTMFTPDGNASALVERVSSQLNISQQDIMEIFSRLLSIVSYVKTVTSNSNVTIPQIESQAGFAGTKLNAEYVRFGAESLRSEDEEVSEEVLQNQFAKYADIAQGNYTKENPYGFGYLLPDRVKLEYLLVNLSDIEAVIAAPTDNEMEEYYDINKSNFIDQQAAENEDTTALDKPVYKPYASVASEIRRMIIDQRKNELTSEIISEAQDLLSAKMEDKNVDEFTSEDYKEYAADYADTAAKLTEKFGVSFYTGTTGYLDGRRLMMDPNIGRLEVMITNVTSLPLARYVFSVEELGSVKLGIYEGQAPKLYQNIGPLSSRYARVTGMVRVVEALPSSTAESLGTEYSTKHTSLNSSSDSDSMYKVRETVLKDCQSLKAMEKAESAAKKLIAAGQDWQAALEEINKELDSSISISNFTDQDIASAGQLKRLKFRTSSMPGSSAFVNNATVEKAVQDSIAALEDSQPKAIEVKEDLAWYAVRDVSISKPLVTEYEDSKLQLAAAFEITSSLESALEFLTADNILSRANFEPIEEPKE